MNILNMVIPILMYFCPCLTVKIFVSFQIRELQAACHQRNVTMSQIFNVIQSDLVLQMQVHFNGTSCSCFIVDEETTYDREW